MGGVGSKSKSSDPRDEEQKVRIDFAREIYQMSNYFVRFPFHHHLRYLMKYDCYRRRNIPGNEIEFEMDRRMNWRNFRVVDGNY